MSPHARLREAAIFKADVDQERAQRKPGEPPILLRERETQTGRQPYIAPRSMKPSTDG